MNTPPTEHTDSSRPAYEGDPQTNFQPMDLYEQIQTALMDQRVKLLGIFIPILAIALIGWAFAAYNYHDTDNKYRDLVLVTEKLKRDLANANSDTDKLRKSMESLQASSIPGLLPFQYNRNFDVNNKYVKRIAFDESSSKTGSSEAYQCRVGLFNQTETTVLPEMVIVFFDRNGFVVDYLHLGNAFESNMKSAALKPNEKRTDISRVIEIPDPTVKPAYFIVNVK